MPQRYANDMPFLSGVVKIYPLGILCWVNKDKNRAQQMFSALQTIYFTQLQKINAFSKTIVPQAQPALIYLFEFNKINSRIKCDFRTMFKVNNRSTRHCFRLLMVNFDYI